MAGDGQQPQILKYALNPTTAALTYDLHISWSKIGIEACDAMNIVGDHIYLTCTFTYQGAISGDFP